MGYMSEIKTGANNLVTISLEIFDQNLGQFLTILPGLGDEGPTSIIEGISIFIQPQQPINPMTLSLDQSHILSNHFEYTLMEVTTPFPGMTHYKFVALDGNGGEEPEPLYLSK